MSPIKVGFVGLSKNGWAGTTLVPALMQPGVGEHYSITAVSTSSAQSASESAQKWTENQGHEVKAYYGDAKHIAADKDVDLVAVSVRVMLHKEAAIRAIEAGKDVFVEWPLGKGLGETVELAKLAKSKGVRNMVGLQGWSSPQAKKVREIIESGKIGRVLSTTLIGSTPASFPHWGPRIPEGNVYTSDATNGATLLDITGGHVLSVFVRALGDVASVIGSTTAITYPTATLTDSSGNPTGKTITYTGAQEVAFNGILTSGAVYSIHLAVGSPKAGSRIGFLWLINGSEGTIRLDHESAFVHQRGPKITLNGTEVPVDVEPLGNIGRSWYEFAKEGQGSYATFEDAVKIHRIIDAVHRSAEHGRRVDLS